MKYPYSTLLFREDDGECYWVARSESLKGCIGTGDTPEEAVKELEENEISWLEAAKEFGTEIPPVPVEKEETYKGKFTVRVAPHIHREASEQAKKQGVSLNQYVNDAIVNYNAEIKSASYIPSIVAMVALDLRNEMITGSSYSTQATVSMGWPRRNGLRLKA